MSAAVVLVCLAVASKTVGGYELDLVVKTTSDWASIRFEGCPVVVLDQQILYAGGEVQVDAFRISQPHPDSTGVTIRYRIMLPEPIPGEIAMTVAKGDIGWVTASFRTDPGSQPILDVRNSVSRSGDPLNEQTTLVERNSLLGAVPAETYDLRPVDVKKLVLAFYYPWYGSPDGPSGRWVHWRPPGVGSSAHRPLMGYYDSQDWETITKHVKWARESGIDAFVVSWWRRMDTNDLAMGKLLEICAKERVAVCMLMEKGEELEESLEYVCREYFGSRAYLRIRGRPVVFYYERAIKEFGGSNFPALFERVSCRGTSLFNIGDGYGADILASFDGFYSYNPVFAGDFKDLFASASMAAHIRGKLYAATVVPGFDQTVTRPGSRSLSRDGGMLYERMWAEALAADPEWVLVTSFNEWHEGTEIEPSKEFGTEYLRLTRAYAERFKRQR